jgi:hypothetical protein
MNAPRQRWGWRSLPLLGFLACLNPQPDEEPLFSGSNPFGPSGQGGGAAVDSPNETPPTLADPDTEQPPPQSAPAQPGNSNPSPSGSEAEAGAPLGPDAGAADAGALVE